MTPAFAKKVRRGLAWLLGLCLLAALGLYANHRVMNYVVDQMVVPDVKESTSPEFVREAMAYGDWVLPADATVLHVEREIIRDRNYRIAVPPAWPSCSGNPDSPTLWTPAYRPAPSTGKRWGRNGSPRHRRG